MQVTLDSIASKEKHKQRTRTMSLLDIGESAFCIDMLSSWWSLIWNGIIHKAMNLWHLWNTSKPEILILVSVLLQMFLLLCGNRRKSVANKVLQYGVWTAYLAADGVAISTLSVLSANSQKSSSDPSFIVMMTWAPFLLLHLGGPDTISALQLEDNELWGRHLLQLFFELLIALFVVVRSWNSSHHLNYITIPMFIAGIIKCVERIWAQRLGSSEFLRKSILPPGPDPGPNYAKFMDEYTARKAEGYHVSLGKVIKTSHEILGRSQGAIANDNIPDAAAIHDGFFFFEIFKCLFADLNLSFQDHKSSRDFFRRDGETWEHAFKVTEIELELMYDRLYTKAVVVHSLRGVFLKLVSSFLTVSAFIAFFLLHKGQINSEKNIVTIVLFISAIVFEMYGFIVLLCSNWAMRRLSDIKHCLVDWLCKIISCYQICFKLSHRWTDEMSQFNFISFCLKDKPIDLTWTQKIPLVKKVEKSYYQYRESVQPKLKELIFKQLKEKSKGATNIYACKALCALRGDGILKKWNRRVVKNLDKLEILDWSINKVDFDQSILLWHIATDLCYHSDQLVDTSNNGELQSYITRSRLLSNYMLYLLVINPSMLPSGIGKTRFDDTLAEASELLQEREYIKRRDQACRMILRVNTEILPSEVKGDRSKSVLFDACRLAKSLRSLESEEILTKEQKWEMMSHVWMEMLCHAACRCRGLVHAKQLRKGGELLTHVWLLMAHFGITEQFQISQGHARAKLSLS